VRLRVFVVYYDVADRSHPPLTEDPESVAEGSCRLGEYAVEDGDRERAAEHLGRAVGTGYPGSSEQAAELVERL
jgi:hypothetical protein